MTAYTYTGDFKSIKVAGILFTKDAKTELTAEQVKTLKADKFGKVMLDDGTLVESKADTKTEAKADSKATGNAKSKD